MRTLSKALEKANRAGKPIIISRLPGSASSQDSAGTAFLTGDPALLMALQPRVRLPSSPKLQLASERGVMGRAADICLVLDLHQVLADCMSCMVFIGPGLPE